MHFAVHWHFYLRHRLKRRRETAPVSPGAVPGPICEDGMYAHKTPASQLFGLDAVDWSVLLLGIALASLLVVVF